MQRKQHRLVCCAILWFAITRALGGAPFGLRARAARISSLVTHTWCSASGCGFFAETQYPPRQPLFTAEGSSTDGVWCWAEDKHKQITFQCSAELRSVKLRASYLSCNGRFRGEISTTRLPHGVRRPSNDRPLTPCFDEHPSQQASWPHILVAEARTARRIASRDTSDVLRDVPRNALYRAPTPRHKEIIFDVIASTSQARQGQLTKPGRAGITDDMQHTRLSTRHTGRQRRQLATCTGYSIHA